MKTTTKTAATQAEAGARAGAGAGAGAGAVASATASATLLAFRSVVYIKQNGRTSFCQRSFWHPDDGDAEHEDEDEE